MRRVALRAALLVAAAAASSSPAHAQARPIPIGTFQDQVEPAKPGPVLSAPQAAAANRLFGELLPIVRANPLLTSSPADNCVRLASHAWGAGARAAVEVSVSFLIVIEGNCYGLTEPFATIRVNEDRELFQPAALPGPRGDTAQPSIFMPLQPNASLNGFPRFGEHVVISRGGELPFMPVSKEVYLQTLARGWEAATAEGDAASARADREIQEALRAWLDGGRARQAAENERAIREAAAYLSADQIATMRTVLTEGLEGTEQLLRARLDGIREAASRAASHRTLRNELDLVRAELNGLTAEQRRAPACLDPLEAWTTAGPAECPLERQFLTRNPGYWDDSLPASAPQLILIKMGAGRPDRGNAQTADARRAATQRDIAQRALQGLDLHALARLLR
jgi:hypothetical protein